MGLEEPDVPLGPAGQARDHGAEVSWPGYGADGLRAEKATEPGCPEGPSTHLVSGSGSAEGIVSVSIALSLLSSTPNSWEVT